MPNCITINSLEHLYAEETLLLHYTITCTGTWYLAQLLTAYRNVCDTEWTVMYPNHQHPRHTDFPITVVNPGYPATFAWNYGGIQGISAENFDQEHSYLTQLTIYNYECFNTGNPTSGSATGSIPVITGSQSGVVTGTGPTYLPLPPNRPPPPNNPVPIPVVINPPINPVVPSVVPVGPNPAGGGNPGVGGWAGGGGAHHSGNPSGQFVPGVGAVPTRGSTPSGGAVGSVGSSVITNESQSVSIVNLNAIIIQGTYSSITRPSNTEPGGLVNPYLSFNSLTRSPAIPNNPGLLDGATQMFAEIDADTVESNPEGTIAGTLFSTMLNGIVQPQGSTNLVNIPSVDYSAYIDLQIPSVEVTYGTPIVISSVFQPPHGVEITARMELHAQDSVGSRLVQTTSNQLVTHTSPLTCGASISSSEFGLGQVILTSKVLDSNSSIVAIKSILAIVLEVNNTGTEQTSKITVGKDLPSIMKNSSTVKISDTPIDLDLPANKSVHIVLEAASAQTKLSSILVTKYNTEDSYQLTVHDKGLDDDDYLGSGGIVTPIELDVPSTPGPGDTSAISNPVIYFTRDKFKINNNVVFPHIHTVGFSDATLPSSKYLILEVAPNINNVVGDTYGKLYLSSNFKLRTVTATVTQSSITLKLPYVGTRVALVIHGPAQGVIPETYNLIESTSNRAGNVSWVGLNLNRGDYFSVIKTENNKFNPFSKPIYTSRYNP